METTDEQGLRREQPWSRRLSKLFTRDLDLDDGLETSRRGISPLGLGDDAKSNGAETCPEASFLAIASGKGGTGKSFLATNLGVSLCSKGRRVTLVDCDFGMANDHLLMGVNPSHSIQQVFAGTETIADVVVSTPYGPDLLSGGSGISRLGDLTEAELLQFGAGLSSIADRSDVMLMDSAAGISAQSILTLLSAQHVVLVTNPEIAAITDAYALVKCLASRVGHPSISIVVNRVVTDGQGWSTFQKLSDVARRFTQCQLHYLGAIPEEPAVSHQRLNQPPLVVSHPTCQASRAIRGIRDQLEQLLGPLVVREIAVQETIENRVREILGNQHLSR